VKVADDAVLVICVIMLHFF